MYETKDGKYRFLNDKPVIEDTIGHHRIIANQLFETIHCKLEKPFVIGLFGSWGTGKSSIVKMLKARCEARNVKTKVVVVDAWRKDKDIFNRQFLKKVARELFGEDKRFEEIRESLDEKKTKSVSGWKPSRIAWILFFGFLIAFGVVMFVALWGWYNNKDVANPFPFSSVAGPVVGILLALYFQLLLPKFSIGTDTQIDDVSVHDIDHFREIYFDKIIGKTTAECVCIVVDNLDRVEAKDALAIMRTLKTFIVDAKEDKGTGEEVEETSLNKVVFVVPCCDKELTMHIKKTGAVEKEAEFLEKFFNVTFRIPEFRNQDAFQYARELLDKMGLPFDDDHKSTICHIICEGYGKNPRKSKIFLNNFLMHYNVAKACEKEGKIKSGIVTEHPDWLAIYMANKDPSTENTSYFKRLQKEISPECKAAIKFLKKPNDFDLIDGFDELLQMARQNEKQGFAERLSKRANESQSIIDAIWRNINVEDIWSQVNTIASVIFAIEANKDITISPTVIDKMAQCLASQPPQHLKNMSGEVVYEQILTRKPDDLLEVVRHFGSDEVEREYSHEQIQYCVDVLKAVLEDRKALFQRCSAQVRSDLKHEIQQVIDRLVALGDEIIPVAIKYPEYKSMLLFNRSLTMCQEGDNRIAPEDIVNYCISLEEASNKETFRFILGAIQCFNTVLQSYCDSNKWATEKGVPERCRRFLKALQSTNKYIRDHNISVPNIEATLDKLLQTLYALFNHADDSNKLEILDTYRDCTRFKTWPALANSALASYKKRGEDLLEQSPEDAVLMFIKNNTELMSLEFEPHVTAAGKKYESVCNLILEEYPEKRNRIIKQLWDKRNEWIAKWIKNNASKMDKEQKKDIQGILLAIANSKQYPICVYQTLSYLKIGKYAEAVQARNNHFDNLIELHQLSSIEGLQSVLERIAKASYQTTDEQNALLNQGWKKIVHETAGNELNRLVKKVIRT